ncbi:MAG: TonB-dependent receptor, partial [Candidatus Cloacimonetes bacterium]|nr:TonB-dependent receptor [Candidatus Cloacimonadota bacterium]
MRKGTLLVLALFLIFCGTLSAGTTGKLMGKIKDSHGKPVFKAAVIVDVLDLGAFTDEKGKYIIINIPPGTYSVAVQAMGYGSQKHTNIKISVDKTTTLNTAIVKKAVQIGGLTTIKAKDELIHKGQAGSEHSITDETIEDIALDTIEGVIALQAGATNTGGELHIRGGRGSEVVYSVDGMSVSDPVDGGRALTVDMDAVKDMKVMTGGFTAEYGNAMSGVVNIVTKSGSKNYAGKVEFSSNHIIGDGTNRDEMKLAIGGPVLTQFASDSMRKRWTFFFNGAASWSDGRYYNYYENDSNEDYTYKGKPLLINTFETYNAYDGREDIVGFDKGNRNYNSYNYNFKTKFALNSRRNLTLAIRGDQGFYEPFNWGWRYALQHYQEQKTSQRQVILTYDHLFNSQMSLKVKANYYRKTNRLKPKGINRDDYFRQIDYYYRPELGLHGFVSIDDNYDGVADSLWSDEQGKYIDLLDGDQWMYQIQGSSTPRGIDGFRCPYSIYNYDVDDITENYQFRTDFEYQYNEIHGFKSGFEIIKHHIEKDRITTPWLIEIDRFNTFLDNSFASTPGTIVDTLIYYDSTGSEIIQETVIYNNSTVDSIAYYYKNG